MDWLEEHDLGPGRPARFHPMCSADKAMIVALGTVRMSPGSQAKRFRRSLLAQAAMDNPMITYPQAAKLLELVHTYRRQVRRELIPAYAQFVLNTRKGDEW